MIEQKLKELIIERFGSISKFAENINMPWTTLDGVLKRGVNKANITSLIKICNGLNIDCESLYYGRILPKQDLLKSETINDCELAKIKKYRSLDDRGKENVDTLLDKEYEHIQEQSLKESTHITEIAQASLTYGKTEYLTGLSAGTGLFVFDDIPTQIINVPEEYKDADFVIGVSGDSMEPTFYDADKVAVIKTNHISKGDIGVFMINGNGYIKELGKDKLISHNKKYTDIDIDETTVCIGKVLGKL